MFFGIDVSTHNGAIDWDKVKASGIEFAMIRAGYGQNHIDSKFKFNISECNRVGIPCGVYWFSYALNAAAAKREAQYCLEAVKQYRLEYPIAFDFEYDSVSYAQKQGVTITKALASEIAKAFCDEIEAANYYVVNYANPDYLARYFTADIVEKFGLWLAAWNTKANPPRSCDIWQFSSTGKVNGISGNVDMNRCYVDFPKVIAKAGKNNLQQKSETDKAQEWAIENGLIKGYANGGGYGWNDALTRGQLVTILYRFFQKYKSGELK